MAAVQTINEIDKLIVDDQSVVADFSKNEYDAQLAHPDPIGHFRAMTSVENPHIDKVMGSLNGNISKEDFCSFCQGFADGMEYVREKYGTQPAGIFLINQSDNPSLSGIFYNRDTYSVYISRDYIEKMVSFGTVTQGKTDPFILSKPEMAAMVGVEEAYHAHQCRTDPEYYKRLSDEQYASGVTVNDREAYEKTPIEYEAMQVVHQAMIDMGIVEHAPLRVSNMTPEKNEWAAPYFEQRTTPANAAVPFTRVHEPQPDGVASQMQTIVIGA